MNGHATNGPGRQGIRNSVMTQARMRAPAALAAGALMTLMAGGMALSPAMAQSDPEQVNRLENSVRSLTGQVEELAHQVRVLQQQLEKMQQDTEFRFSELQGGSPTAARSAPSEPAIAPSIEQLSSDALQLGAPPQDLGTLRLGAASAGQPIDLSEMGSGDDEGLVDVVPPAAQMASLQPTGNARTDYDQAYAMIRSGQYDIAEGAFRLFLTNHPDDELAPEAQYWLGESLFARGEYGRAAEEFRNGYKSYPKSRRGPDTLLKLGLSMAGMGYREEACQMYAATLKQYPQMSNGLRQRVITEQASAGC